MWRHSGCLIWLNILQKFKYTLSWNFMRVNIIIKHNLEFNTSYLSPMVNLSSRLQASTKQFRVRMIISGELYTHLSLSIQEKFRLIDQVTVKGSSIPIDIFCFDIHLVNLHFWLRLTLHVNLIRLWRKTVALSSRWQRKMYLLERWILLTILDQPITQLESASNR